MLKQLKVIQNDIYMYVKVSNYVLLNLGMFCGEHYPSFRLNYNLCLLWWVGEKCQSVFIFELLDTKWTQSLTILLLDIQNVRISYSINQV